MVFLYILLSGLSHGFSDICFPKINLEGFKINIAEPKRQLGEQSIWKHHSKVQKYNLEFSSDPDKMVEN